jgi:hypothetical protein
MSASELAKALAERNRALAGKQSLTLGIVDEYYDGWASLHIGGAVITSVMCANVAVAPGDRVVVGILRGTASVQYFVLAKLEAPTTPPLPGTPIYYGTIDSITSPGNVEVSGDFPGYEPGTLLYGQVLNSYDPVDGDEVYVADLGSGVGLVLGKIGAYAGGGGGGGGTTVYIQSSAPSGAVTGDFWLQT